MLANLVSFFSSFFDGQKRLKAASVLCIGSGGLGSPLLLYLAAAGIGRIGLVDFDIVDSSNFEACNHPII